jgi:hypothetical protein
MRPAAALPGTLVALAAAGALLLLLLRTGDRAPDGGAAPGEQHAAEPATADRAARGTPASDGMRAPLREAPGTEPAGSARRCRVRDAESRAPLAGAELRAARDGRLLATTDAAGEADIAGMHVTDIVFGTADYLLEFHSSGSNALAELHARSGAGILEVLLHRDEWSLPQALRFSASDGSTPAGVRARLRIATAPADGTAPVDAAAPDATDAWRRHFLVASLWGMARPPYYHFAASSSHVVFEVPGEAVIRFAAAGDYDLEAVSAAGEVARQRVRVARGQAPLHVRLRPGSALEGIVVAASDGAAIGGAAIHAAPALLGAETASSAADGSFRLAPLPADVPLSLRVEHPRFFPAELPAHAGARALRIALRARPLRSVLGTVRSRPDLRPLPGARLVLRGQGRVDSTGITAADGTFELLTALEAPELRIEADGFAAWVELVEPGASRASYDLLPAGIDERVRAGLSAKLSGTVRDARGAPRPGAVVQLIPGQPATWEPPAGRRILEGGALQPLPATIADGSGRFVLECAVPGAVRLVAVDGNGLQADGLSLTVRLGTHHADLVLETPR